MLLRFKRSPWKIDPLRDIITKLEARAAQVEDTKTICCLQSSIAEHNSWPRIEIRFEIHDKGRLVIAIQEVEQTGSSQLSRSVGLSSLRIMEFRHLMSIPSHGL